MITIAVASLIALLILLFFGVIRGIIPAVTRANHEINTPSGIDQKEMAAKLWENTCRFFGLNA